MKNTLLSAFPRWLRLGFLLFALGWATGLRAQDAAVEVTVNSTQVNRGDVLRLAVTFINCKVKEIDPPQIEGLEWRMGPSTSNSTQWVNGVTTSEQRYTYGYVVTGSQEIAVPALSWNTNKGALKSNPIRILVLGARESGNPTPNRAPTAKREVSRDLVTSIEPSKRTVYLGEPLVLSYKIYNRYNNLDVRNYDIPELEGFWKETVATPDARWEPQLINGKRYNVATVRQIVAFPQQTGKLVLDDFTLNGYLRINFFEGREIQATCDPVEIEVLPLPEVAPSTSLGTFANLSVEQRISADSVSANEAVTLEITFRGTGNLKFLREPELAWPTEFEVFDPEVEDNISITTQGESGTRKFKYVAIPRAPGDYRMPAFEATSFDPLTAKHLTSRAPGIQLHVSRDIDGAGGGSAAMTFSHQQDVQVLNRDVRHILSTPSRFLPKSPPAWARWALTLSFLASPLTFAGFAAARRARRRESEDAKGTRRKKALKVLQRSLQSQGKLTPEGLGEAMEQYLMAKLGWERSQLTRDAVRVALLDLDANLAEEWDQMWVAAEMVRYGASSGDLTSLSNRLLNLAETTEASWKS
jgi:hypothetical protein